MKPPTLNPKFAEVIVEPPSSNRKRLTTINRTVRNNSIEDNQIIEDNPITKCSKDDLSSNSSKVMSRDIIKEDNHFMEDNRNVTVKINPSRISSEVISINDDIEDNQIVEDNHVANCIRNSMVTTINVAESVPKENIPSDKNPIIVN